MSHPHNYNYNYYIDELPSTNSYMQSLLAKGNIGHMTTIRTGFQTAGRGQMGNKWESAKDKNLLFSMLLQPKQLQIRKQFYLSKAVSIAIIEVLNGIAGRFEIKWPNDIYYNNLKIAGILIENNLRGEYIENSIVGIGLNINQTEFISDAPNPVSLKMVTGIDFDIESILDKIKKSTEKWIITLNNNDLLTIDKHYAQNLYRKEGIHKYRDQDGTFEATLEAVMPEGYLALRDGDGRLRTYAFKEVAYII